MAACSFLDGQRTNRSVLVNGDVVKEIIVGFGKSSRENEPRDSSRARPL